MSRMLLAAIWAVRRVRFLHRTTWRVRKNYNALKRHLFIRRPLVHSAPLIETAILSGSPFAAAKMGSLEAAALRVFLQRTNALKHARPMKPYPSYLSHALHLVAGVFPKNDSSFDDFAGIYLASVSRCDALVSWDVAGEAEVISQYCPGSTLVHLRTLEPYFCDPPWSRTLRGKRVLVISPFAKTIAAQYSRREKLWCDPDLLPPFSLITLRAPLSAGLVPPSTATWIEALESMKNQMSSLEFDVALIGAGAFSLPLALFAKERGKVGVHLGGGLQILFGIMGGRWERNPQFAGFVNAYWCRPSEDETPTNFMSVENGSYW